MKQKFLLFALFLFLLVGLYSPTSYSQTYNMWLTHDILAGNTYSFDVYIQRTGATPLSVYSFQMVFTYTASTLNGGTLTGVWFNVDSTVQATEAPKTIGLTTSPYIKCGFNVNSTGTGSGITISDVTPLKIGTIILTNSVPFTGFPLVTWYFGGAPGLPTKIQASNGTLAYAVTANGTFGYAYSAQPTLLLTSPNGGNSFTNGSAQNITWIASPVISTLKIELTIDNGVTWNPVVNSVAASLGTYSWTVPNTPSTNCKIKITDANDSTVFAMSNRVFTIAPLILTSPNGGNSFIGGSAQNITWIASPFISTLKIELTTDNGVTWNSVVNR